MARAPRALRRRVLRFETRIETELEAFARSLPSGSRVLDGGSGECQYAHLFDHCRYVGVDLGIGDETWNYSRIDAAVDLAHLPFRAGVFDAALSVVVLEHTREPLRVVSELARVLKPRGRVLLVVPQEWEVHQAPHDYFRYTRYGLQWLLEQGGLEIERLEPIGGFFTLLGRRLIEAALFFQGGWRWLLFPPVALVAGPTGMLLPELDRLDRRRETTLGYVCMARGR